MANYIDKVEFLNDIRQYRTHKQTNPDYPITRYSADAILMIAEKMSNRPNFIGYSYKQDMISDGIYVCLKYFDSFDPDHPAANPFGYFSQIVFFAFLQRIAKEKKQTLIRSKILAQVPFNTFDVIDQDLDENFKNSFTEFLQEHNHVELAPKIKKSKAKNAIEECFDDEIDTNLVEIEEILKLVDDEDVVSII